MILSRFIAKWSVGNLAIRVDPVELDSVETRFRFKFPLDFRHEILRYGIPQHPSLYLHHSILKTNLDIGPVAAFMEPGAMIEYTQSWYEHGLPADCVAFAVDVSDNVFCFQIIDRQKARPTAPVWLFDFNTKTTTAVAPSFTAWITQFCEVEFVGLDDEMEGEAS